MAHPTRTQLPRATPSPPSPPRYEKPPFQEGGFLYWMNCATQSSTGWARIESRVPV